MLESSFGTGLFAPPKSGNSAQDRLKHTWLLTGQITGQSAISTIRMNSFPFRVGRSDGLSLTIPYSTVSSLHAEFIMDGDNLCLRDLGSTNGTFVNGIRIKVPWPLNEGDVVQFAGIGFRVSREVESKHSQAVCQDVAPRGPRLSPAPVHLDQTLIDPARLAPALCGYETTISDRSGQGDAQVVCQYLQADSGQIYLVLPSFPVANTCAVASLYDFVQS